MLNSQSASGPVQFSCIDPRTIVSPARELAGFRPLGSSCRPVSSGRHGGGGATANDANVQANFSEERGEASIQRDCGWFQRRRASLVHALTSSSFFSRSARSKEKHSNNRKPPPVYIRHDPVRSSEIQTELTNSHGQQRCSWLMAPEIRPCLVPISHLTYKSGDLKPVTYKSWVFCC